MTNPTQPAEGMPERWQLVPVEPTEEMLASWPNNRHGSGHEAAIYHAMLAAAPKAPPMPDEVKAALRSFEQDHYVQWPEHMDALLDWLKAQGFTKE